MYKHMNDGSGGMLAASSKKCSSPLGHSLGELGVTVSYNTVRAPSDADIKIDIPVRSLTEFPCNIMKETV